MIYLDKINNHSPAPYQRKGTGTKPALITWAAHLRAYAIYSELYGREQTAERLAQRGGFGESELDELYPEWKNYIV